MLGSENIRVHEVEVSLPDLIKRYREKFAEMEQEYSGLFAQLDGSLGRLGIDGLSARQREDVLLDSEYLLVRLRSRILCELSSVQSVLSMELRPLLVDLFKARQGVLTSYMSRLNELRADCEVIQRTRYVDSFRK